MAELMTEDVARESVNKGRLVARLAHEDVSWDWRDAKGEVVASLRKAADWADVIVVSRHIDTSMIDMRRTTAELVVKSGKPVIAVPPTCDRLDLSSSLVAWDGSACAAKALKAAIPLLQKTDDVILFEALDGSIVTPAEDAAVYLSRHDVHASVRRMRCRQGDAADLLLRELKHPALHRFGYVVLGGFGHDRFVEAVFGGVTRTMLTKSPVPVFLAH
jgi:nucleotide-binding universal stress UspA family protein